MATESNNDLVRYRKRYPYSVNKKDRFFKYDILDPSSEAFRRYRTEPQEGHNPEFPTAYRRRVRLNNYDLEITRAPKNPNPRW